MEQSRGILLLKDPLHAGAMLQRQSEYTNSMTLIFNENGRYLSLAQTALWHMRKRFDWVCVAAEGSAACIAVALAAQLPVDRLVLMESSMFMPGRNRISRELLRLERYARRNLSLVISELLLLNCREEEIKNFLQGRRKGEVCALECRKYNPEWFICPWEQLGRNNLLIPSECV